MSGFDDLVTTLGESVLVEDIYTKAGSSWEIGWTLLDGNGAAIDITAATVRCEIRPDYTGTPIFTFATSGATGTTNQLSDGTLKLLATPANTAGLAGLVPVSGLYDVKVTASTGRVAYISSGVWRIFPEVTI